MNSTGSTQLSKNSTHLEKSNKGFSNMSISKRMPKITALCFRRLLIMIVLVSFLYNISMISPLFQISEFVDSFESNELNNNTTIDKNKTANIHIQEFEPLFCKDLYIDLGSNIGVLTRKLFEPQRYPTANILNFFDAIFGNFSVRRTNVCSFGFEPNPIHQTHLKNIEKCYNSQGWKTKFDPRVVFVRDNKNITFYSDNNSKREEWGSGLTMVLNNVSRQENNKYNVSTIDIARFIKDLVIKYNPRHVFVKMDIEGAEWLVIPHLLNNGILCKKYIDTITIEIHSAAKKEMRGNWSLESLRNDMLHRNDCVPTDIIELDDETFVHDNMQFPHECNIHLPHNEAGTNILQVDGLKIDEFITNSVYCNQYAHHEDVLLFDVVPLHSVPELHLLAIRYFELCPFVDLFIIVEIMYYPDGRSRNSNISLWSEREKYINYSTILKPECLSKIIHHTIYKNIYNEGKHLGLSGEKLERKYFNKIMRNLQIKMVFRNCFKYFGDKQCTQQNMHNMFMIASDTDEIPRRNVLKLVKHCDLNYVQTPIIADIYWHAYDFGCHLTKHDDGRIKIVSLKDLSASGFNHTILRKPIGEFVRQYNNITYIKNAGWHLTYFGDVSDIIEKNKNKAHLGFHYGRFINTKYQQCLYELCCYSVIHRDHSDNSYRVPFINISDAYYPMLATANLSSDKLSPFINSKINPNPNLYHKWLQYMNTTNINSAAAQKLYCNKTLI